ncbi:MAG: NUDIX hydrolase [Clostridiales bacterium]|jgi:ADP-ribose pyrophosphatase|nr:NUDIX hydrolase [Clostridiales bacterium]
MEKNRLISSETVYKGRIINVKNDVIEFERGKQGVREIVVHGGAAAIVAVDRDGKLLFVRQYRHSTGKEVLEIPAGTLEKGEDPDICAVRELEEETGYKAGKISFLIKFYSAIGFCTEVLHIYLAEDLEEGHVNFDEDEYIELERYSLDETVDMIFKGEIIDSKTIASVLAYKELLNRR